MTSRALLVYNPAATMTDERVRDVIAAALASTVELHVAGTDERGHATDLAAKAVADGYEAVFALGGDGTANEAMQAVAGTNLKFGIIPGGSTNVMARALGLPNDAVRATSRIIEILREGRARSIGLGRANGRWFGIIAGLGFDAAVVRSVESQPTIKQRVGQMSFVGLGLRQWFAAGDPVHSPSIDVVEESGETHGPYGIAIVGNGDPYTYLGRRPLSITPFAHFDTGLDVTAISEVNTARVLRLLAGAFRAGRHLEDSRVAHWHDLSRFTLRSSRDLPWQVDGDHVGMTRELHVEHIPRSIQLLA